MAPQVQHFLKVESVEFGETLMTAGKVQKAKQAVVNLKEKIRISRKIEEISIGKF